MVFAEQVAWKIITFFLVLGLLLQIFGFVKGPFNFDELLKMSQETYSLFNVPIIVFNFIPEYILKPFLITLSAIIGLYFGTQFIGLITGKASLGMEFRTFVNLAALSVVLGVVGRVFDTFAFFWSLGIVGQMAILFLAFLFFYAVLSIIFIYAIR
jgi:hypothetical protein